MTFLLFLKILGVAAVVWLGVTALIWAIVRYVINGIDEEKGFKEPKQKKRGEKA